MRVKTRGNFTTNKNSIHLSHPVPLLFKLRPMAKCVYFVKKLEKENLSFEMHYPMSVKSEIRAFDVTVATEQESIDQ